MLGEEYGVDRGQRLALDHRSDRRHQELRTRRPVYATLIALEHDGVLELGVVSAPALGQAMVGRTRRRRVAQTANRSASATIATIEDAFLSSDSYDTFAAHDPARAERFDALAQRCARTRGFGDFWSHMLVAEGAIDIAVEPEVLCGTSRRTAVIVEAAGGRFTNVAGVAGADGGSALATNGVLHDAVLAALES